MSDRTIELSLVGLPRERIDEASGRLFALGALGLQEDWLPGTAPAPRQPWDRGPAPPLPDRIVLRAWFEAPDQAAIEAAVADLAAEPAWVEVEDRDWEAIGQSGFAPIEIGEGIVVAPPWDAPPGALIVDPGQGFGTGHHPSTAGALRALHRWAEHHRTALDVGTGSGILAIAAARLGLEAEGIDVEPAAIRNAEHNAALNGVTLRLSTTPIHRLSQPADLVLANLHAELIDELAEHLDRLTGRTLILAGILDDREPLARRILDRRLTLAERMVEADTTDVASTSSWVCLVYRRSG